jgi:tetratricopeptide (TPR) repeat protein
MFTTRPLSLTGEALKWLAILTLASLLAALAAQLVSGHDAAPSAPALLPPTMEQSAKPMAIWRILADQKSGNFEQALEDWPYAPLSCDAEVWRQIAIAQAQLAFRDVDAASDALHAALAIEPANPVAHYFRGILRMEQAAMAREWQDAIGPVYTRLVSTAARPEPALTKSMYQLAARMEFEQAIEEAKNVNLELPLGDPTVPTVATAPTVRDLLRALGAEDFEGKAHHQLSYLLLENGSGQEAEQHLDAAAELGQQIVFGYQDLGAFYEGRHDHLDAARAYAKALSHGSPLARPTQHIVRNLRLAFIETW